MSYDLSIIVAMVIAVGSSTSTASRSTSTALLSTPRTGGANHERFSSHPMLFAKQKIRVFTHLTHQPLLVSWEEKGSYDFMGFRSALEH